MEEINIYQIMISDNVLPYTLLCYQLLIVNGELPFMGGLVKRLGIFCLFRGNAEKCFDLNPMMYL